MTPFGHSVLAHLAGEVRRTCAVQRVEALRARGELLPFEPKSFLDAQNAYLDAVGHLFNFIELGINEENT